MSELRVAVLMGGPSSEHDVSMSSGRQVLAVLPGALEVVIQRDALWRVGGALQPSIGSAIDAVADQADVVFIALHGPFGEDGTVQGLLDSAGLSYVGSGVAASSLAMDKIRTKQIYRAAGLPTPDFEVLRARGFDGQAAALAAERIGLPAVVKQSCNGSSFGVSFPKTQAELLETAKQITSEGGEVLLEAYIKGQELTCAVLDSEVSGLAEALPVTEIKLDTRFEFFDYEAKYTPGAAEEITPARIMDALRDEVQSLALRAHEVLGCRDMSRTDFILDAQGCLQILETNTIPGLTGTSLLPQAAEAAGISFAQLVARLVANAALRRDRLEAS